MFKDCADFSSAEPGNKPKSTRILIIHSSLAAIQAIRVVLWHIVSKLSTPRKRGCRQVTCTVTWQQQEEERGDYI